MVDKCLRCEKIKPIEDLVGSSIKVKGYIRKCKECQREESLEYRKNNPKSWKKYSDGVKKQKQKRLQEFIEYKKTLSCLDCGMKEWYLLEFHHLEPDQKDFLVSRAYRGGYSWDSIMKEVSKCVVLCCNCHTRRHWKQRNENTNMLQV